MVYGAVPVKDEENPLLGVRSSSKRPRSFAYGVIAVVCVAALAISGVSRATDESSREDHLSALGDLSNDYLAKRSWWQDVKTANETLITAKQASDKAMEAAAEAEEKFDELKLDAEEKDRMCTDIHKAEDQTSGCDDHCSTGAVQASRLGWGSWSRSASRSVTRHVLAVRSSEVENTRVPSRDQETRMMLPSCPRRIANGGGRRTPSPDVASDAPSVFRETAASAAPGAHSWTSLKMVPPATRRSAMRLQGLAKKSGRKRPLMKVVMLRWYFRRRRWQRHRTAQHAPDAPTRR